MTVYLIGHLPVLPEDDGEGLIVGEVFPIFPLVLSLEVLEVVEDTHREGDTSEDNRFMLQ